MDFEDELLQDPTLSRRRSREDDEPHDVSHQAPTAAAAAVPVAAAGNAAPAPKKRRFGTAISSSLSFGTTESPVSYPRQHQFMNGEGDGASSGFIAAATAAMPGGGLSRYDIDPESLGPPADLTGRRGMAAGANGLAKTGGVFGGGSHANGDGDFTFHHLLGADEEGDDSAYVVEHGDGFTGRVLAGQDAYGEHAADARQRRRMDDRLSADKLRRHCLGVLAAAIKRREQRDRPPVGSSRLATVAVRSPFAVAPGASSVTSPPTASPASPSGVVSPALAVAQPSVVLAHSVPPASAPPRLTAAQSLSGFMAAVSGLQNEIADVYVEQMRQERRTAKTGEESMDLRVAVAALCVVEAAVRQRHPRAAPCGGIPVSIASGVAELNLGPSTLTKTARGLIDKLRPAFAKSAAAVVGRSILVCSMRPSAVDLLALGDEARGGGIDDGVEGDAGFNITEEDERAAGAVGVECSSDDYAHTLLLSLRRVCRVTPLQVSAADAAFYEVDGMSNVAAPVAGLCAAWALGMPPGGPLHKHQAPTYPGHQMPLAAGLPPSSPPRPRSTALNELAHEAAAWAFWRASGVAAELATHAIRVRTAQGHTNRQADAASRDSSDGAHASTTTLARFRAQLVASSAAETAVAIVVTALALLPFGAAALVALREALSAASESATNETGTVPLPALVMGLSQSVVLQAVDRCGHNMTIADTEPGSAGQGESVAVRTEENRAEGPQRRGNAVSHSGEAELLKRYAAATWASDVTDPWFVALQSLHMTPRRADGVALALARPLARILSVDADHCLRLAKRWVSLTVGAFCTRAATTWAGSVLHTSPAGALPVLDLHEARPAPRLTATTTMRVDERSASDSLCSEGGRQSAVTHGPGVAALDAPLAEEHDAVAWLVSGVVDPLLWRPRSCCTGTGADATRHPATIPTVEVIVDPRGARPWSSEGGDDATKRATTITGLLFSYPSACSNWGRLPPLDGAFSSTVNRTSSRINKEANHQAATSSRDDSIDGVLAASGASSLEFMYWVGLHHYERQRRQSPGGFLLHPPLSTDPSRVAARRASDKTEDAVDDEGGRYETTPGFIFDSDDDAALEAEAASYIKPLEVEAVHQMASAGETPGTVGSNETGGRASGLAGLRGTPRLDHLRSLLAATVTTGAAAGGVIVPVEFYGRANPKEHHVGLPRLAYLGLAAGATPEEVTRLLVEAKGARRMTVVRWSELLVRLVRPAPLFDFGLDFRCRPEHFSF